MLEEMLLCGVTVELFARGPLGGRPEGPENVFVPATTPFEIGGDVLAFSE